ncbi:hypothetical protein AVEN_247519-1 [Araneus ventricosus]|uniref:Uncharacterized protein n=1 Tax=Araneus ventricosus TaxID=182803 RepID=A0A4Y2PTC6_ARAVE|nr:hypothetical protein AVEN_247519-1 [Araneus ventricosus]
MAQRGQDRRAEENSWLNKANRRLAVANNVACERRAEETDEQRNTIKPIVRHGTTWAGKEELKKQKNKESSRLSSNGTMAREEEPKKQRNKRNSRLAVIPDNEARREEPKEDEQRNKACQPYNMQENAV